MAAGAGLTSHCGAGCTLGDVLSKTTLALTGLVLFGAALGTAYLADFAIAYVLGVLFQFWATAPMQHLVVRRALWPRSKPTHSH